MPPLTPSTTGKIETRSTKTRVATPHGQYTPPSSPSATSSSDENDCCFTERQLTPPRNPLRIDDNVDHNFCGALKRTETGLGCFTFIPDGDFDIVWINCVIFGIFHLFHFLSIYYILFVPWDTKLYTWFFGYWVGAVGGLGITAGAHRLWSHKSYDACLALRIFLMIGQCIAGQNSLYVWCRDHRVHHKFSETDGDPHNTNRGFFFAHVGWLLRKKHPEMMKKSRTLDFSDLMADPVIRFQKDNYLLLYIIFAMIGPSLIPCLLWGENFWYSLLLVYISRYVTSLHSTWFVNSTAHMFGDRPYNLEIQPRENYWVSYGAFGEGYHNYHHTFPWDYATAELGGKLNVTKKFIDTMAYLGLASNLKKPSNNLISSRKEKVMKINEQQQQ